MRDFITELSKKVGPRAPCSSQEREAAIIFYNQVKDYCAEIEIEYFNARPGAYKASFKLPMIFYLISIFLYWYFHFISVFFAFFSFLILFGEMAMAKEVIDFIFSEKKSQNVIAKVNPAVQKKNLVIIGSHLDSNWEFPLIRKLKYGFVLIIAINLFLVVSLLIILVLKTVLLLIQIEFLMKSIEVIFYWFFLITIPIPLIQFFFIISNRGVIGANDNLSGMAVCHSIAKALGKNLIELNNVEVWICAYGCEEIGSKGSKNFVMQHYEDLKNAKIINLDMIGHGGVPLFINTSEVFGLVKMNKNMINLIQNSAKDLSIELKLGNLMAFTDSLSFARKRLATVSISTLPRTMKNFFYHTREDVLENLDFENLIKTFNLCINLIKQLDRE